MISRNVQFKKKSALKLCNFIRVFCVFCLSGMCFNPDMSEIATISDDVVVRRMLALFDYDPWESSPNIDSEVSVTMTHELRCVSANSGHLLFQVTAWFVVMFQNYFCPSKDELGFRSGDIIYVLGDMDQDGFYSVSVNSTI